MERHLALTKLELPEITGYQRTSCQVQVLKAAGIFHIHKKSTNTIFTTWHHVLNPQVQQKTPVKESTVEPKGRRRNAADAWMPPRVYKGRSAYEWHPCSGGCKRLCSLNAKQSEVWQAYETAIAELDQSETITTLVNKFFGSLDYKKHEGIFIEQGKTGSKQIKEWSPGLKAAVQLCDIAFGERGSFVIHQKNGSKFCRDTFNSRWSNARQTAREETGLELKFTFHDLKAEGISDFEGSSREKQAFSGHKTERQVATYDRKVKVVKTITKK